jgi:hypothetical protein
MAMARKAKAMAAPAQRLTENPEFVRTAFGHWLDGMSAARIARLMRPEWPAVSQAMVDRLARENGWRDSRAEYLALVTRVEADSRGLLPQVIMNLRRIQRALDARGHLNFMEIAQYRGLCEDLLWYTGAHPKLKHDGPLVISSDEQVTALMEALRGHKVIGPLLRRHRTELREAVEERLGGDGKKSG